MSGLLQTTNVAPVPDCLAPQQTLSAVYELIGEAVLLPIPLGEKRPVDEGWQTISYKDSLGRPYQQRLVEAIRRGGNIGVRLGPASSRLWALDLDDDSIVDEWITSTPWLANTLRSRGRRGCQFWLRLEPGCEFPNGKAVYKFNRLRQPASTKDAVGELRLGSAGGAQSVIWGQHPDGPRYQVLVDKPPLVVSLADLDELVPGLLNEPKQTATVNQNHSYTAPHGIIERVRAYLDKCEPAVSKQNGHDTTFRVLCAVIGGFDLSSAQAWEAALYYSQKCEPPWSEKELRHKVDDALKATASEPRGHLLESRNDTPLVNRVEKEHARSDEDNGGSAIPEQEGEEEKLFNELLAKYSAAVLTSEQLETTDIPPRKKLVGEWLYEGDLGFVYGERGSGKTWFVGAVATHLSAGANLHGWAVPETANVMYVDGEMPIDSARDRLKGMKKGNHALFVLQHEMLFQTAGIAMNLTNERIQRVISAICIEKNIKLLILDNLSCLFSGVKENDADEWEKVLNWLLDLRRRHVAVLIVHHAGVSGRMRGTTRREDAAFWVIQVDEVKDRQEHEKGACFHTVFTKQRNSESREWTREWIFRTEPSGQVVIGCKEISFDEKVLRLIKDGLTSATDIATELGVNKSTVSRAAGRLMDQNLIELSGKAYRPRGFMK